MKFSIKKFRALLAKAARSAEEEAEFVALKALSTEAGYDPETGTALKADPPAEKQDAEDVLTEDAVKQLVADGLTKALTSIGLDAATVKAISDSAKTEPTVDLAAIEKAIKENLGGESIDQSALIESIKTEVSKNKGITSEDLDKKFKDFADAQRTVSKMQFPTGIVELPIEHRNGNMTVAEKQLVNIMLKDAAEEGLRNSNGGRGIARPKSMDDGITADQLAYAAKVGEAHVKRIRQGAMQGKALTTGGSNAGGELVPTDLSTELLTRLYLESMLAAAMVATEIDMPTPVFELPLRTTRTTWKVGTQNTAGTESSPGTGEVILTARKLIGMADYSYEIDEDSAIAIAPMLITQLSEGAAEALEDAIINGDTTATHQDTDTELLTDPAATLFKGLRKYALAGSTTTSLATGGISGANILAMKKAMGKYGLKPRDLLIICGIKGHSDFLGLDETLTADKVGSNVARILTGEAASLFGSQIIPSALMREDLNASGVNDGVTTTKGSLAIIHRRSWVLGVRRGFLVEVEQDKKTQTNSIIASFRRAFMPMETPSTTIPLVQLGYNFTS